MTTQYNPARAMELLAEHEKKQFWSHWRHIEKNDLATELRAALAEIERLRALMLKREASEHAPRHGSAFTGRDREDIPSDARVPSRIDIIGQNGNDGEHYQVTGGDAQGGGE